MIIDSNGNPIDAANPKPVADAQIAAVNDKLNEQITKQDDMLERLEIIKRVGQRVEHKGYLLENFSKPDTWTVAYGAGVIITDAENVKTGSKSTKLTGSLSGASAMRKTFDYRVSSSGTIYVNFFAKYAHNIDVLTIYFASKTNFSVFVSHQIYGHSIVDGWNSVPLDPAKFYVHNNEMFDTKKVVMQVRIDTKEGATEVPEISFDSVLRERYKKPQIIFCLDDGWDTQYTEGFKILSEYGFKGVVAVIEDRVGAGGYMTHDQLQEVYDMGWDLANHTVTHANLGELSTIEEIEDEINGCTDYLTAQGWARAANIVIYPFGSFNDDVLNVMQSYRSGRTVKEFTETSPPAERYKTKVRNLLPYVSVDRAKAWVDETIDTGGTTIFLNHIFEQPADTSDAMRYDPAKFREIVAYVYERRHDVDVVTYSEWLDYSGK